MRRLLIIADDFTGALDTGVQFAARGAVTRVIASAECALSEVEENVQVLVVNSGTRHLSEEEAYQTVRRIAAEGLRQGFSHLYKKTDSALRGHVGAELRAVMDASGSRQLFFFPAFPQMDRTTWNGIHFIGGVPVAQSVFGQDPFEPVRSSSVSEILAAECATPVVLHRPGEAAGDLEGIHVYDSKTVEDLRRSGTLLGADGLRVCAGCAGFAGVLAKILSLAGKATPLEPLTRPLFVVCGSVNPITVRQMEEAQRHGFGHVHLTPEQKLDPTWPESPGCLSDVRTWRQRGEAMGGFLLDANDPLGSQATSEYAEAHGLGLEELRTRIADRMGLLTRMLLDEGFRGTILCTGGDTLMAFMQAVGSGQLQPERELNCGVVLASFHYKGKTHRMISKSGGFGGPDLLWKLAAEMASGNEQEELQC